jgi:ribosomal protein S18 acetylase RimI-like enzyme
MNPNLSIRLAKPEDETIVLDIIERTGFFRPVEIDIAREVFIEAALRKPGCTYQSYVTEIRETKDLPRRDAGTAGDGRLTNNEKRVVSHLSSLVPRIVVPRVIGWVCFGETPCTLGTFDIYWIAVEPTLQRQGAGKFMLDFVEKEIKNQKGRLAVVETSGMKRYESTQKFYEKNNYTIAAKIPNFYALGDDKLIYIKTL